MKKETSKLVGKQADADTDDDDIYEGSDFITLAVGLEEEAIKVDSRRKIEIYLEKKRLKDQFDDIDESEFGF
jgi:hypothetical protein